MQSTEWTLPRMRGHFVDGQWLEDGDGLRNDNPSDLDDDLGEYALGTVETVAKAVAAARQAQLGWLAAGIQSRSDRLDAIGDELRRRHKELGWLISREEGKPLFEGEGEALRAAQVFKWFAGEALRLWGERIDSVRPGVEAQVYREPVGVVGLITPWNFPFATPAWKLAAAMAFGNTVVWKPAELTPAASIALMDVIARHVPAGVCNLVLGRGESVGAALTAHGDVDAVSFTGSVDVGAIVRKVVAGRAGRVQLEMGGKNPLVVLDDADLDIALDAAIKGSFYATGQRCTNSSRILVTPGIRQRFTDALVERMRAITVGHALDASTEMGPVVDEVQLRQNLDYLEIGRKEGAQLLAGGEILQRQTRGHYMAPALFVDADNSMRISREEIFGPITAIIGIDSYDEGLAIANDTTFGLSSSIITRSLAHAQDFKRRSTSGVVMVNLPTSGVDYHVPFGGRKASNYGPREQGTYAREFYTVTKTTYERLGF
jgi:acyl-CoA reductase-like NAD-dependent aldehyde dehydrogenase